MDRRISPPRPGGRARRSPAGLSLAWHYLAAAHAARREGVDVRDHGAAGRGPYGRAFPTAQAMAAAPEHFYKTVAGAGYRGAYLKALSLAVAEGRVDVESLGRASRDAVPDDEVAAQLQALPGVGPYAAAPIMLMLGRYPRLLLDPWTRPKYARLLGRKRPVSDRTILRRFQRYGPYAGLAFWLILTRDWITDEAPSYSWVQP